MNRCPDSVTEASGSHGTAEHSDLSEQHVDEHPTTMSGEHDALLRSQDTTATSQQHDDSIPRNVRTSIYRTPLVAFLACFGMTAAAASSVFVFAHILCKDPASCDDNERDAFARSLAIATTIANVCAVIAIQPLYAISRKRPKLVLLLWLVCRALSVAVLFIGAVVRNMHIVILSKVLEGIATDNILQFALTTIYARAKDGVELSSLMAESMAYTLAGSALGPLVASIGGNFQSRLLLSLITLSATAIYAGSAVNLNVQKPPTKQTNSDIGPPHESLAKEDRIRRSFRRLFSHLHVLLLEPVLLAPGLALLLYTTGQGYVLPALMVYSSGRFGFTDRKNSWLLSLVIAVSAAFAILTRLIQKATKSHVSQPLFNTLAATVGLLALGVTLPLIMKITSARQFYIVAGFMSLGITSSSFIKALGLLQLDSPENGTGALAIFETVGSLLSPVTLGYAQTKLPEGQWTLVTTTLMGVALIMLLLPTFR